jgi:hypothetical protein
MLYLFFKIESNLWRTHQCDTYLGTEGVGFFAYIHTLFFEFARCDQSKIKDYSY